MSDKPWDTADIGILALKMQRYTWQLLLAKNLITLPELQNLADQLIANADGDKSGEGVSALARMIVQEVPGITVK